VLRNTLTVTLTVLLALPATTAAGNGFWFGRVDLVEKVAHRNVRFFIRNQGLSLFARGDTKEILLQGFFTKARMSVEYTHIVCPNGINGTCGWVNFVSIDKPGNF